jgi:ParB family chromosome partitioning protein
MKKKALGKGLKAFLPEEYGILKDERYIEMDIERLKPNPHQPRKSFDDESINDLARSIKESGVLQPIIAVQDEGYYKIIVGERRWRASQKAGLKKIPVLIRSMTDAQQLEASLIENLQREDLNPIEIAKAYQNMTEKLNYSQKEVSDRVGKDRASVANYIRLLKLPLEVQDMLQNGSLTMGHARALVTLEDPEEQISISRQIKKKQLSVREVEKIVSQKDKNPKEKQSVPPDPNLLALQEEFLKLMGTKVSISGNQNKGIVKIYYFSVDELNNIFEKIKGEN